MTEFFRKHRFNIIVGAIVTVMALYLYVHYRTAPQLDFSQYTIRNLDGKEVRMESFSGKTVFLNFWATWCPDCVREMPSIVSVMQQLDSSRVVFLFVSDESPEKIRSFDERKKFPFRYYTISKPLPEIGIHAIPTTYIMNKKGEVVFEKVGGTDWSQPDKINMLKSLTGQ